MIGGSEPANSGSHAATSSSSAISFRSTNVMNVAAVSHFVDEAIEIRVAPDIAPTACSWITEPSAPTTRIRPADSPAARTRSSSKRSVVSNASRRIS